MPEPRITRHASKHSRPRDIQRTRADIIEAARIEFADKGLSGARVDEIAARTQTTKPTIYYHFGNKEGLYVAVLEQAYGGIREVEQALQLDALPAPEAMTRLVEVSFDYHAAHPDWVRLVSVENIHGARHIAEVHSITQRNALAVETVRRLLERGEREGAFRPGVDPLDLHLMISSLCFYRVSNRHTWQANFGRDLLAPERASAQRRMAVEAVLRYLQAGAGAADLSLPQNVLGPARVGRTAASRRPQRARSQ